MHLVFNNCPYLKYFIIIIIVAGLMKASPSNYLIYDIHETGCSRIILRSRNQHKGGRNSLSFRPRLFLTIFSVYTHKEPKSLIIRYILYKTSPKSLH